jgi:hypothetical protein
MVYDELAITISGSAMAPKGQVAVRMNVDSSLMPSGLGTMFIENIRNHRISPPG